MRKNEKKKRLCQLALELASGLREDQTRRVKPLLGACDVPCMTFKYHMEKIKWNVPGSETLCKSGSLSQITGFTLYWQNKICLPNASLGHLKVTLLLSSTLSSEDKFITEDRSPQRDPAIYYLVFVLERELKEMLEVIRKPSILRAENLTVTRTHWVLAWKMGHKDVSGWGTEQTKPRGQGST